MVFWQCKHRSTLLLQFHLCYQIRCIMNFKKIADTSFSIETMKDLHSNLEEKDSPSILKMVSILKNRTIHCHINNTRIIRLVKQYQGHSESGGREGHQLSHYFLEQNIFSHKIEKQIFIWHHSRYHIGYFPILSKICQFLKSWTI